MEKILNISRLSLAICTLFLTTTIPMLAQADDLLEAKKHFSLAVQYKKGGEFETAFEQYNKSLAFCDTLYQVHYSYGDLLVKLERYDEARAQFLRVLELDPENYNAASVLATMYYNNEQYDSTLVMYEKMYALKPDNSSLAANIAALKAHLGDTDNAFETYDSLLADDSISMEQLLNAAQTANRMGKTSRALDYAAHAVERDPHNIDALRIASENSLALGYTDDAIKYLYAWALADSTNFTILERLENTAQRSDDPETRIWALERKVGLAPQNASAHNELAEAYLETGNIEKGIQYSEKAVALEPDNGLYHLVLGEYHRIQGNTSKALQEFRLALNDERWKSDAQALIWQIEQPETNEERREREFFNR